MLKGCKSSDIWDKLEQIKPLFAMKLRAHWNRGMLAIIQCRIFCLPICYQKI